MAAKQTRIYFCRSCDERHPAPTNAKCQRNKEPIEGDPPGERNDGKRAPATNHRAKPAHSTRANKRLRQGSSSPEAEATDRLPVSPKKKRRNFQATLEPEEHSGTEASLDLILQRLDSISSESREAREKMASDAKADREDIRKSISAIRILAESHSSVGDSSDGDAQGSRNVSEP